MSLFTGKKVLITGGLGFIGSNLAIHLVQEGASVAILDSLFSQYGGNLFNVDAIKDQVQVEIADVRDNSVIQELVKEKDFLFNLAGQTSHLDSMSDPIADLEINAKAQLAILEACRNYNPAIKILFAGTRQVYGRPKYLPVNEEHPTSPVDVNGINKLAGESFHLLYHSVYGLRTVVLRLTNTYGPRMRVKDARQTFLGIWIRNAILNEPFVVFGDGLQLRDFNYVDDVVAAMLQTITDESSYGKIYNLGAEDVISLLDLAKLLEREVFGSSFKTIPFPPDRLAIDIGDYYGDFSKIKKAFSWSPKITLVEGLKRTVNYYRTYGEKYW